MYEYKFKKNKTGEADPVCFLKMTVGKAVWQIEGNRVGGKDTNLDVIPSASAADALIRQKGNMLFCNASSYLKPLLLNFAAWIRVTRFFIPEQQQQQHFTLSQRSLHKLIAFITAL